MKPFAPSLLAIFLLATQSLADDPVILHSCRAQPPISSAMPPNVSVNQVSAHRASVYSAGSTAEELSSHHCRFREDCRSIILVHICAGRERRRVGHHQDIRLAHLSDTQLTARQHRRDEQLDGRLDRRRNHAPDHLVCVGHADPW